MSLENIAAEMTDSADAENNLTDEEIIEKQEEDDEDDKKGALLFMRRNAKGVNKRKLFARGAFLTAAAIVLLMAILFAISALMSFKGAFTIKTLKGLSDKKRIALSETSGFANPVVELSAKPIYDMDNITYKWLPLEELDARDGSHNGENYIDYTYYITNAGSETLDFTAALNIVSCSKNIDRAVRVMIYRNGVPTIYAREASDGKTEPYPENIVDFSAPSQVMQETVKDFAPGDQIRYTVVVWLEGEDPECVDAVVGGAMKLEMIYEVAEDSPEEI